MTASAQTVGLPIVSVLSLPARVFLLGTVAIGLVAILRVRVPTRPPVAKAPVAAAGPVQSTGAK